ncbi:MAG: hypothetical protein K6T94_00210 [Paenibacillus sp.]|nr:hypothetical protein [Paenibacillus sp.]
MNGKEGYRAAAEAVSTMPASHWISSERAAIWVHDIPLRPVTDRRSTGFITGNSAWRRNKS